MTSIVILSYNTMNYLQNCIASIRAHTKQGSYELIVVDNASHDGSVEWLRQQTDVLLLCNDENQGFSRGCNQGAAATQGEYILFLNSDTIVTPHWLENLEIAIGSSPCVGAVGPMADACPAAQRVEVAFSGYEDLLIFALRYNQSNVEQWEKHTVLTGFCFLIKRAVWQQVGGFDERFSPAYFEDDDLSLRILLAGYDLLVCKDTFIHHAEKVSMQNEERSKLLYQNQLVFQQKWHITDLYRECNPEALRKYLAERAVYHYTQRYGCTILWDTEIFLLCHGGDASVQAQSFHALCQKLNDEGVRAFMVYIGSLANPVHALCERYRAPMARQLVDVNKNLLIVAEADKGLLEPLQHIRICIV